MRFINNAFYIAYCVAHINICMTSGVGDRPGLLVAGSLVYSDNTHTVSSRAFFTFQQFLDIDERNRWNRSERKISSAYRQNVTRLAKWRGTESIKLIRSREEFTFQVNENGLSCRLKAKERSIKRAWDWVISGWLDSTKCFRFRCDLAHIWTGLLASGWLF